MNVYFRLFFVQAMLGSSHGAATTQSPIVGCPPSASISPCTCSYGQFNTSSPVNLYVYCNSLNFTDSQLSNILNVFLSPQYISSVFQISASQNKLTQVPNQISQFSALTFLDLSYNQIVNISSLIGFSFSPNAFINVMLNNNKIAGIPSGTFNLTSATSIIIDLSNNNITALPIKAFTFPSTSTAAMPVMNMLTLMNNQITTIAPGAFQGIYHFI